MEEYILCTRKHTLRGLNARGSRRQWWETTKPGRGGGRECCRWVLHPPLPLSLTYNLRLLPNVRPWADQTGKPGVFVRHCASLSTSIIHEGSRVHLETCAYACVRIDCTSIITRTEERGCFSTRNVTESTRYSSAYSGPSDAVGLWSASASPSSSSVSASLSPPLALTQPLLSPITPTVQDQRARLPVTARQMMRCPGPLPRLIP